MKKYSERSKFRPRCRPTIIMIMLIITFRKSSLSIRMARTDVCVSVLLFLDHFSLFFPISFQVCVCVFFCFNFDIYFKFLFFLKMCINKNSYSLLKQKSYILAVTIEQSDVTCLIHTIFKTHKKAYF